MKRLHLKAGGGVQGVGFRPFVFRLAERSQLTGWVMNSPAGVVLEVQGESAGLETFLQGLEKELPPAAFIESVEMEEVPAVSGETAFEIRPSGNGELRATVMPDLATCPDCVEELFDPSDRRYMYPFTNCTNCGPRFTIISTLPYDRPGTTMADFDMCPECMAEYSDPGNRRFHAQPNACPVCGPRLFLRDGDGKVLAEGMEAFAEACEHLLNGMILAVKGLGGFHLMTRADSDRCVAKLRKRKNRPHKPVAAMIPSSDLIDSPPSLKDELNSSAAPIMLIPRKETGSLKLSDLLSPGISTFGLMVPSTPLHHMIMRTVGVPLTATSGNRRGEPICTGIESAVAELSGIADLFLDNDRRILRPVDDSVISMTAVTRTVIRRSRGFVPLPVPVRGSRPGILALGGDERNVMAVSREDEIVPTQYLGDMSNLANLENAAGNAGDFAKLLGVPIRKEVVDMHPDYSVRQLASSSALEVQHHYAHVLSCMAENRLEPPVLGIVWDGSGYGPDGTVWGGEFIEVSAPGKWRRICRFRPFPLPGAEKAVRFPARAAAGMLFEAGLRDLSVVPGLPAGDREMILGMLEKRINSPLTSSAGRLFDGISALLGICDENTFSGRAAMMLQSIAGEVKDRYPVTLSAGIVDWAPVLIRILNDIDDSVSPSVISGRFHSWMARCAAAVAASARILSVVLSGGCFQNSLLLEMTIQELEEEGFEVYTHRSMPPGDGGLCLGQAVAAMEVTDVPGDPGSDSQYHQGN